MYGRPLPLLPRITFLLQQNVEEDNMNSISGDHYFCRFLAKQHCVENLIAYRTLLEFEWRNKYHESDVMIARFALYIYAQHIRRDAPLEVRENAFTTHCAGFLVEFCGCSWMISFLTPPEWVNGLLPLVTTPYNSTGCVLPLRYRIPTQTFKQSLMQK